MVSIWVGIYKGDANYMMNDFVDFACTGDAITVSEPTIVKQLKESIVVSYETGYEYACVTSGTAISDVPEENGTVTQTDLEIMKSKILQIIQSMFYTNVSKAALKCMRRQRFL